MDLAELALAFGPFVAVALLGGGWWLSLSRRRGRPGPAETTTAETALRDRADELRVEAAGLEGQAQVIEERAAEDRAAAAAEIDAAHAAGDAAAMWDRLHGRR